MRFIESVRIDIPRIAEQFELGDLTIFIGRQNSGKTRILRDIDFRINHRLENIFRNGLKSVDGRRRQSTEAGFNLSEESLQEASLRSILISAWRSPVSEIKPLAWGLNKINSAASKIDPLLKEFGTDRVIEKEGSRNLTDQGSGIQNIMQIITHMTQEHNLLFIDEPENSLYPQSKLELLKIILGLVPEKQIVMATHDPTMINPYLIKSLLGPSMKVIVYSFNGSKFTKVNFVNEEDPETHIGYLRQSFSTKPVHLVVEGQTEVYAMQALIYRYCVEERVHDFPKIINKIAVGHIEGRNWKVNLPHLPSPEYYRVLMMLDGEHSVSVESHNFEPHFKKIKAIEEMGNHLVNVFCLKAVDVETALIDIFPETEALRRGKPCALSQAIWSFEGRITDKLKGAGSEARDIYKIVQWAVREAQHKQS